MGMVTIECPKCGGQVKRKKNEYFAFCPFCGAPIVSLLYPGYDVFREQKEKGGKLKMLLLLAGVGLILLVVSSILGMAFVYNAGSFLKTHLT